MHCRQQNLTYTAKNLEVLRERINVGCPCCHRRLSSGHVLARMRFFEIVRPHAPRRFVRARFAVIIARAPARVAVAAMGSAWLFMRFVRMDGRSAAVAAPRHLWRETEKFFESGREKAAGWEVDRERMGDGRVRRTIYFDKGKVVGNCLRLGVSKDIQSSDGACDANRMLPDRIHLDAAATRTRERPRRRCSAGGGGKAEAPLFCFRLSHARAASTEKTEINGTGKRYVQMYNE